MADAADVWLAWAALCVLRAFDASRGAKKGDCKDEGERERALTVEDLDGNLRVLGTLHQVDGAAGAASGQLEGEGLALLGVNVAAVGDLGLGDDARGEGEGGGGERVLHLDLDWCV